MVVAKAEVDYLVPIYEGGRFYDVNLWVESIGNSSFSMGYEVVGDEFLEVTIPHYKMRKDLPEAWKDRWYLQCAIIRN